MNREELSKAARRFAGAVENIKFNAFNSTPKDKDKNTDASKAIFEVRQNSKNIIFVDSMEEAETIAAKLNAYTEPFIQEELELLKMKVNS